MMAFGRRRDACLRSSRNFAIFPVKFPISRECLWRRVRSALRCQPPILETSILRRKREKSPPLLGFCYSSETLMWRYFPISRSAVPRVSGTQKAISGIREQVVFAFWMSEGIEIEFRTESLSSLCPACPRASRGKTAEQQS